jgi:glucosamine-6-phosphate deaminase
MAEAPAQSCLTVSVSPDYGTLCAEVAGRIAALIRADPDAVLGLATGATPQGVYQNLVRMHQDEGLDFSRVTCFNLDEYYLMAPESPHSYDHFMRENLFDHINCRHWHVPDGRPRTPEALAEACADYEALIREAGGIDLQLLGIGRTGHLGFNEPGSPRDSRTRLVALEVRTREDAAAGFGGLEWVPTHAVTMGLGTVLEARSLALMASGAGKAAVVRAALRGPVTEGLPASLVRTHPDARVYLDRDAATELPEDAEYAWQGEAR